MKYIICLIAELACMLSANAQNLVHTSQATPSQPPSTINDVQAASTSQFINSIGVACHFDYYWTPYNNFPEVEALLLQSGIPNIRDGGTDPIAVSSFRALHNDGIDVTWVMDAIDGVAPTSAYWTASPHYMLTSFLENVLGSNTISAIEISNEIDIFYGKIKWHPQDSDYLSNNPSASNYWGKYIQSLVQDTSTVVRQDPALASIPLIGTSFGLNWAGVPAGAFYPFVDQGAIHPYMYRGNWEEKNAAAYDGVPHYYLQSTEPSVLIDEYPIAINNFNSPYQSGSQQEPLVATETGYFTGIAPYSIDESTHAKYVPRIFAEFFRHGIAKAFIYEFVDEGFDGGMENSFGLVRGDLTPKPAYAALQSMIALLQDSGGSFSPAKLTYGFVPSPDQSYTRLQYAHDLLLQKSDGDFFLLFWHDISDASMVNSYGDAMTSTDLDVTPEALPAVITVPANIAKATLYSYDSNWKLQATPLTINAGSIQVQVSDELSVLQLQTSSTALSATTTTLRSRASHIIAGQPFLLTATVSATSGLDTPSGTVSFYLGQQQIGTATLAGGAATLSVSSGFSPGNYNLTASYSGSNQDDASTSVPLAITIAPFGVATTTTLLSSASQITQGQPFLLSAAVVARSGSATPSGTAAFYLGQQQIGTATLTGGKATLSVTNSFSPGNYNLTASYSGSTEDDASTSAPVTIMIVPAIVPTTTTLTTSASQIMQGQSLLLSASVTPGSGSTTPSGTVSFYVGQMKIGTAALVDGKATLSETINLSPGTYTLTATYAGNGEDNASTSAPVTITIVPAISPIAVATTTTLTLGSQPLTVGQVMVLQVGVGTTVPGNLPSGTATLYLDGAPIGTLIITGGAGSFSLQAPQAGTHTVWAVFAAQGNYLSSRSPSESFTIQSVTPGQPSGSFTVALSTGSLSLSTPQAEPASLQVTAAPSGGYTGSIQFSCSGLPPGISSTFSPARVTVNGAKAASTLTLSGQILQTSNSQIRLHLEEGLLIPWATLGLCIAALRRRHSGGTRTFFLALALLAPAICVSGCGLTINNVTRPYIITVTAVDQNQKTETTTFTLNVTQPAMTR